MPIDRERSVDLTRLTPEEVENISNQIGIKVREMVDEAANKINNLLRIYQMEAKMEVRIFPLGQVPSAEESVQKTQETPKPKKRGRPRKQS